MEVKLQYFGHLMQTVNSLEKILMLGKTEGRRRRGRQRMRWLDGIIDSMDREGRDLGVAFQAPPGSQASSRGEAKDSALLSSPLR